MTAGNQKALHQQVLENTRMDMLSRYPMGDFELWLLSQSEDPCLAALAPAMSELLPLLVVDPPAAIAKIREHLKITPKPKTQRARGRPKGSKTDTTTTIEAVKLWEQGHSDQAIYDKLKPFHPFDGGRGRRAKIYTFSKEKQARIRAAHKAGKACLKAERGAAARLKKSAKKNPVPNFLP